MKRREFTKLSLQLGALSLLDLSILQSTYAMAAPSSDLARNRRLSWLAFRSAAKDSEGERVLTDIEGEIPRDLSGTLYKVGPGQKIVYGVQLQHLFDGDAYMSGYQFRDGQVRLKTKFINTPKRQEEASAKKMIYSEFGTHAPATFSAQKSPPNVNIMEHNGRFFALSEGSHPSEVDPNSFNFKSLYNFEGSLKDNITFTAHPRKCPKTGDCYTFGQVKGRYNAIHVFRIKKDSDLLELLHVIPTDSFYLIHDMIITEDYVVFHIPSVKLDKVFRSLFGVSTMSSSFKYFSDAQSTILILSKEANKSVQKINLPASMIFHLGNGFNEQERLYMDTLEYPNGSIMDSLASWNSKKIPASKGAALVRYEIDLTESKILSRQEFCRDVELPTFDPRRSGLRSKYLFAARSNNPNDPLHFNGITRQNLISGETTQIDAPGTQCYSEPLYVPNPRSDAEDSGWVLFHGYDASRDESFLEIRDAGTMDFHARVWSGTRFSVGIHSNFIAS